MTWKPDMTLDELGTEMKELCVEVNQIEASGKTPTKSLCDRVAMVIEDLRYNHGRITTVLNPEVPAETQRMFFELEPYESL